MIDVGDYHCQVVHKSVCLSSKWSPPQNQPEQKLFIHNYAIVCTIIPVGKLNLIPQHLIWSTSNTIMNSH